MLFPYLQIFHIFQLYTAEIFHEPSGLGFLLFTFVFIFVFVTAKVEEEDNIKRFGDEYLAYMKTTKMFLPFLI